jgi:rsbT co-antagonist protein RsbR
MTPLPEVPYPLQSFELLQAAIDSLNDPIFVKDRTHIWVACNQAFCDLIGQPHEAIIGHTDQDYLPPEQVAEFMRLDTQVMQTGELAANEELITGSNGVQRSIYTRKYPLRDEQATVVGLVGIITDITDIRQRQEQIAELEATLAEKAETIEHQRILLQQVSVPVIQVWDGILLLPLLGVIDSYRAVRILESMLEAIANARAQIIILDITGVPIVDTSVASYIIQGIQAAHLLGCESVLVGIGPHIAQTMVQLGMDFSHITTLASLQQGLAYGLRRLNYRVSRCKNSQ